MKSILATASVAIVLFAAQPASAIGPEGTWLTQNGRSHITIELCGNDYCGRITALADPVNSSGFPKRDINNPDPSMQGRPLIGLQIILGMASSGTTGKWEGQIYNPEDGDTYQGSIELHQRGLKVEGCVAYILCQSQIWTRVNAP